jgi:hypothetical protein
MECWGYGVLHYPQYSMRLVVISSVGTIFDLKFLCLVSELALREL